MKAIATLVGFTLFISSCAFDAGELAPPQYDYVAPPTYFTAFAGNWVGTGPTFLGKEIRPGAYAQQITIYQMQISPRGEAIITVTDATGTYTKPMFRLSPLNETTAIDGPAISKSGKSYWNTYELGGNQLVRREHGPNSSPRPFVYKRSH